MSDLKLIDIADTNVCYICGSPEIDNGNSMHMWHVEYECGCKICGALGDKDIYLWDEAVNANNIQK